MIEDTPIDLSVTIEERVSALLGAASRVSDLRLRAIYLSEARIQIEIAREKISNLGVMASGQEAELVRLRDLAEGGR